MVLSRAELTEIIGEAGLAVRRNDVDTPGELYKALMILEDALHAEIEARGELTAVWVAMSAALGRLGVYVGAGELGLSPSLGEGGE